AADHLAERGEVRRDAAALRKAAAREAESADDLVEDQHGARALGLAAERREKLRPLEEQAVVGRHGLDDDGGDLVSVAAEEFGEALFVVERKHDRLADERRRHALG